MRQFLLVLGLLFIACNPSSDVPKVEVVEDILGEGLIQCNGNYCIHVNERNVTGLYCWSDSCDFEIIIASSCKVEL